MPENTETRIERLERLAAIALDMQKQPYFHRFLTQAETEAIAAASASHSSVAVYISNPAYDGTT